jgi:hypothetical protein
MRSKGLGVENSVEKFTNDRLDLLFSKSTMNDEADMNLTDGATKCDVPRKTATLRRGCKGDSLSVDVALELHDAATIRSQPTVWNTPSG